MSLFLHEHQLARDLDMVCWPPANWPAEVAGPDGRPMLDVLVVGGGVFGLGAAAALIFKGIRNIAILDRAPEGREGVWTTTARMPTLRSPKHMPGLSLGLPALTFRAWYTACNGEDAWNALYKVPNTEWQTYLSWVRRVLGLPVSNNVAVRNLHPRDGFLQVETTEGTMFARRVVLATGRSTPDTLIIPDGIDRALWPDLAAHTAQPIDFFRLSGMHVVVMGGGSSAWDNAATALEHGAARVDMYVRRPFLPQINKMIPFFSPGFYEGWSSLSHADRWDLLVYLQRDQRAPPPHESVLRTVAQANFTLHLGTQILSATPDGQGVSLCIGPAPGQQIRADFLILATGFDMSLTNAPELAEIAPHIATWADIYTPPPERSCEPLGQLPFLSDGFELTEKTPGACPEAYRVHVFNHAAFASTGALGSEIPAISVGVERLASRIAAALAVEDISHLRKTLRDYNKAELERTPYYVPQAVAV